MGIRVGERTQTIVILLARRIPKGELNVFSIDFDIGHVVFKDRGDVYLKSV